VVIHNEQTGVSLWGLEASLIGLMHVIHDFVEFNGIGCNAITWPLRFLHLVVLNFEVLKPD
jgi:hypothetical protein